MQAPRWRVLLRRGAAVATAFATVSSPPATSAVDSVAADTSGRIEEIIVTARRREELLLDVPVAVSVFTGSELAHRQIVDLAELQYAAPSLVITSDQTNRSSALVAMRGQFQPMTVPTLDPTVGVYLDGVYIARITGANLRLIDMERVEVLRGPQGTLFGRNTIGGAINIVTSAPSRQLEGYVEATAGNFDRRDLTAVLNLPIRGGDHALRLVAAHAEHHGYGRSGLRDRDLNDEHSDFGRLQLRLAPAEPWELTLSGDYTRFANGGQLWTLLEATPLSQLVTAASGNPTDDIRNYVDPLSFDVPANRAGSVTTTAGGLAATLRYLGPAWTFTSITAHRRLDSRALDSDQDGTPYDLTAVLRRDDEQDQFSQEVQLSGDWLDTRLDWFVGAHYFVEHGWFDQDFLAFSPLTGGWVENLPSGSVRNDSASAYAQIGYALSPRLRILGGLRVSDDGRQLTSRNARRVDGVSVCRLHPALRDSADVCRATLPARHFRSLPFLLGLDFTPLPDALLYAKLSRGYRSGGYNFRAASPMDVQPFGPERVTAWEAGARADLLDSHLRVDLAAFHSSFDEIQLVQSRYVEADAQTHLFVENGGTARIAGGELEVTALLGRLRLQGMLGAVDARYTRLHPNVVEVTRDSWFLHTPEHTAALSADWQIDTFLGGIDLHVDHAWRDDVPFEYDRASNLRQEAYGLWNARGQIHLSRSLVCVGIWGRNLAGRRYFTRALDNGIHTSVAPGDPRTLGLSFRVPCAGS